MAQKNGTEIFKGLQEQLAAAMEDVQKEGSLAFAQGDMELVTKLTAKRQAVDKLRKKLESAERDWQTLFEEPAPPGDEEEVIPPEEIVRNIERYIQQYRQDRKEQDDLFYRKQKYEKVIPAVLENITHAKSRQEFMEEYSKLTGQPGQPGLFHSGGLVRHKNKVGNQYPIFIEMILALRGHEELSAEKLFEKTLPFRKRIKGLGVNVSTEVLNTLYSRKCPVVNMNSLTSALYFFKLDVPKSSMVFTPQDYGKFAGLYRELMDQYGFESMGAIDHFFNYIYFRYAKQ